MTKADQAKLSPEALEAIGDRPGRWREVGDHVVRVLRRRKPPCGWEVTIFRVGWRELGWPRNVVGLYATPAQAFGAAELRVGMTKVEHVCAPGDIDRVRKELAAK